MLRAAACRARSARRAHGRFAVTPPRYPGPIADHPVLDGFSPAVRAWFGASFPEPTAAQVQGWPPIAAGEHTLICAPTGSGKTLAAFLSAIDRLVTDAAARRPHASAPGCCTSRRCGRWRSTSRRTCGPRWPASASPPSASARPSSRPRWRCAPATRASRDRQRLIRRPPDLLITTPESLYLMLTSSAAETLAGVETVIVDEIHALAPTKRGAHLALSLERLEEITARPPQRIGLSATQRPLEEVARFLGGWAAPGQPRPVTIVDAGIRKPLEIEVVIPVEDMGDLGASAARRPRQAARPAGVGAAVRSIWPSIYPRILDQVLEHRSTIIFCNARRQAERLAAKLNELGRGARHRRRPGDRARCARSWSRPTTARWPASSASIVEDELKRGELRAIVATSSLELGIDMGAVDLVIQVESPGAVSRGLQRIGRAGHQVGEPSKGSIYPKHRGDLLEAAVVARRMLDGQIESTRYLRNPLDVLAQQIVAHTAAARRDARRRRSPRSCAASANFAELSDEQFANTLDLLAGRYPSEEFSELRPRVVWNRVTDTVRARDGSKRLAVTSRRHDPRPRPVRRVPARRHAGRRARRGDGLREPAGRDVRARRVDVAHRGHHVPEGHRHAGAGRAGQDAVLARRPPGPPARARPGARRVRARAARAARRRRPRRCCASDYALDELAAANLLQYVDEQAEATGVVPDDRTIVVERFRDEIGDWRVCLLSPFGTPVHAPWAMAIERRLTERYDMPVESMWGDDGIVLRLPEAADELPLDAVMIDPEDIEELVVATLPQTALFSSRFRRVRRAGAAAAAPPARPAHAAVAAAPEGRRPARRGREVPDVPDPARGVAGVPAGRVRRAGAARGARPAAQPRRAHRHRRHGQAEPDGPEPAVQLDRRLHVRGRRPAGRAPGRRAGARPRPAARPARRRGAARAARPRRARRRRARPAAPLRRPPGPQRRRAARRPAPRRRPDGRRARPALRRAPTRLAGRAAGREAGDRGRRRGGDPVRRGRRRRPLPRRARVRAAARAARGVHRAGAAAARGPRRPLRPHPRPVRRARGRRPLRRARGHGSSGVLLALEADGPRRARRVPARGRAARVVRRRRAAPAAAALAGHAAPGGRAGRAGGAGPVPAGVARHPAAAPRRRRRRRGARRPRRRADRRVDARGRRPRRAGRRLPPGAARRAVHVRRRRVGRRRGDRLGRRPGAAVLRRPAAAAGAGVGGPGAAGRRAARRHPHRCSPSAGPASGASCGPPRRARADDELLAALWDLVWAGEVTNDSLAPLRAVTGRAGPRGRAAATAGRARARARAGSTASGRRPAPAGGASSRRCSSRRPRRPRRPTPWRCSSSSATASSPARPCSPRASSAGTPRCTACSRCSRSAARCAAATSSAASARPSSPCPAPSTGCALARERAADAIGDAGVVAAAGRARRHRPGPAVRRHARLAGHRRAGRPARPPPSSCCATACRSPGTTAAPTTSSRSPHTLDDRSWAEALADLVRAGRLRKVEVRKVDGEPLATSPVAARSPPPPRPPASPTATAA